MEQQYNNAYHANILDYVFWKLYWIWRFYENKLFLPEVIVMQSVHASYSIIQGHPCQSDLQYILNIIYCKPSNVRVLFNCAAFAVWRPSAKSNSRDFALKLQHDKYILTNPRNIIAATLYQWTAKVNNCEY